MNSGKITLGTTSTGWRSVRLIERFASVRIWTLSEEFI